MDANYRFAKSPGATSHTYASGQAVGTTMLFDLSGFRGVKGALVLEQVLVADPTGQAQNAELVLMSAAPSVVPVDNTAFAPANADLPNIMGIVPLSTHHTYNSKSISRANQLAMPLKLDPTLGAAMTLFAVLVTKGTPTYVGTTDLTVTLTVRTPDSLTDGAVG